MVKVQQKAKQAAGELAASMVQEGTTVGLGTGSTAACFIDSLARRVAEGLQVLCVATSERSQRQAEEGGIPMTDIEALERIDAVFDGADEIDPQKRLIKGGGGALLREKIVASMSGKMVVLVDESKCVEALGAFPLPVEIVPFAHKATIRKIEELGCSGSLRQNAGTPYRTDGGHYIYDIRCDSHWGRPDEIHSRLLHIPGVVETGFFIGYAGRVLIGKNDGTVEELP